MLTLLWLANPASYEKKQHRDLVGVIRKYLGDPRTSERIPTKDWVVVSKLYFHTSDVSKVFIRTWNPVGKFLRIVRVHYWG